MTIKPFKRTQTHPLGHLVGEYVCPYADLVKLFGESDDSDGCKVSSEWCVTNGKESFTIYDWKETQLYNDCYPTVEDFRAQPSYSWHIGGTVDPQALIDFLSSEIGKTEAKPVDPPLPIKAAQRPYRIEALRREYELALKRADIESRAGRPNDAHSYVSEALNKSDLIFCLQTDPESIGQ